MQTLLTERFGQGTLEPVGTFHHCDASRYVRPGQASLFIKNLEPSFLAEQTTDERYRAVELLEGLIHSYYRRVRDAGLQVPKLFETHRLNHGPHGLIEVSSDAGVSAGHILRHDCSNARVIVANILRRVSLIFQNKHLAIDPQPNNWVIRGNDFTFVDFQPAYFEDAQGHWVGFPPLTDQCWLNYTVCRYFNPFGSLRILRFNLMRIHPELENTFFGQASWIIPHWREYADLFQSLPERRFCELLDKIKVDEAIDLIESLDQFQVDSLREIAFRLLPNTPVHLSRLFELTHLDFRLPESTRLERLNEFKRELFSIVRGRFQR